MIASLQITTAWKNRSLLAQAFYTSPFKVADITEDPAAGILQLMLMNTSPGILEGDQYKMDIKVGAGSMLHLQTQSYQRIFTMQQGARQIMEVTIDNHASFIFLPHPTVPHKGSVFTAENTICLSAGATLLWSEIITCGRKGCGEIFSFSKYHSRTNIYRNGKIVLKENILLEPAKTPVHSIGQWESYTHQASLVYLHEETDMAAVITALHQLLASVPGICYGISQAPVNGLLVRMLGHSAEPLHDLCKQLYAFISRWQVAVKVNEPKTSLHAC